ncbi:MAG: hypothetical protein K1X31_14920 [Gemmatimonadaceae bacterium]|nr:hypothetical protein [Gemmatimonadaceae bacterium]
MTINRIRALLAEATTTGPPRDYHWLTAKGLGVPVSAATARAIERQLAREPAPEWLTFRDLSGSRIRIRAALIERLTECTAAQRAADRAFQRAREKEEREDPPFDSPWEE